MRLFQLFHPPRLGALPAGGFAGGGGAGGQMGKDRLDLAQDAVMIDRLALAFIACRLGYIGAYLADLASVRSGFWFAGVACCIGLFVVAS